MKPTQEQKDLINAISKEISGWANTNDYELLKFRKFKKVLK